MVYEGNARTGPWDYATYLASRTPNPTIQSIAANNAVSPLFGPGLGPAMGQMQGILEGNATRAMQNRALEAQFGLGKYGEDTKRYIADKFGDLFGKLMGNSNWSSPGPNPQAAAASLNAEAGRNANAADLMKSLAPGLQGNVQPLTGITGPGGLSALPQNINSGINTAPGQIESPQLLANIGNRLKGLGQSLLPYVQNNPILANTLQAGAQQQLANAGMAARKAESQHQLATQTAASKGNVGLRELVTQLYKMGLGNDQAKWALGLQAGQGLNSMIG